MSLADISADSTNPVKLIYLRAYRYTDPITEVRLLSSRGGLSDEVGGKLSKVLSPVVVVVVFQFWEFSAKF